MACASWNPKDYHSSDSPCKYLPLNPMTQYLYDTVYASLCIHVYVPGLKKQPYHCLQNLDKNLSQKVHVHFFLSDAHAAAASDLQIHVHVHVHVSIGTSTVISDTLILFLLINNTFSLLFSIHNFFVFSLLS